MGRFFDIMGKDWLKKDTVPIFSALAPANLKKGPDAHTNHRNAGVTVPDMADARQTHQLYLEISAKLMIYGRSLGLSHQESEDVLQDTFIEILAQDKSLAAPKAYCVRAFRNRALNYKRGFFRRLKREFESKSWFENEDRRDPREITAMRCLAEIPRDQREVIVLKIWQDLTFREIADIVGLSPNTVAGRYRYGMAKLRHCFVLHEENAEDQAPLGNRSATMAAAAAVAGH